MKREAPLVDAILIRGARQFLERMDKPQVDAIEGIPPAIAIDQTNPVRTSRSTVGTMTELNDHLKLLYARASQLHCRGCGKPVRRDTPQSIYQALAARPHARLEITFAVPVPKNFSEKEVEELLQRQGYTRLRSRSKSLIEAIQDRVRAGSTEKARVMDAMVNKHGLKPYRFDEIVAWPFGDYVFNCDWDVMSNVTKSRLHGLHAAVDSEEMFVRLLGRFRAERIVP